MIDAPSAIHENIRDLPHDREQDEPGAAIARSLAAEPRSRIR
jgi:hypothetical protein